MASNNFLISNILSQALLNLSLQSWLPIKDIFTPLYSILTMIQFNNSAMYFDNQIVIKLLDRLENVVFLVKPTDLAKMLPQPNTATTNNSDTTDVDINTANVNNGDVSVN